MLIMKTSLLCLAVLVSYMTHVQSLPNRPGFDPNILGLKTIGLLVKSVFDAGLDILRPTDKKCDNNILIINSKAGEDHKQPVEKVFFEDNNKRSGDQTKNNLGDTFMLKYNPITQIFERSIKSSPLNNIENFTPNIEPLKKSLLKPDLIEENNNIPRHFDEKLAVKNFKIKNEQNNLNIDEKFHHENVEFDESVSEKEIIYDENRSVNSRGKFQQYKHEKNKDFVVDEELHKELKVTANFDDGKVDIRNSEKIGKEYRSTSERSGKNNDGRDVIDHGDFKSYKEDEHYRYNNEGRELSRIYPSTMRKPSRHIYEQIPSLTVKKLVRNDDRLKDQTKLESYDTKIFDKTKTVRETKENFGFDETMIDDVMEQDVIENFEEHENYNRNVKNNPSNQPIISRKKTFSAFDERQSIERDKDKTNDRNSQIHDIDKREDAMNHNREAILEAPVYVLMERPFFPQTRLRNENLKILLPERRLIPRSVANTAEVRLLDSMKRNIDNLSF